MRVRRGERSGRVTRGWGYKSSVVAPFFTRQACYLPHSLCCGSGPLQRDLWTVVSRCAVCVSVCVCVCARAPECAFKYIEFSQSAALWAHPALRENSIYSEKRTIIYSQHPRIQAGLTALEYYLAFCENKMICILKRTKTFIILSFWLFFFFSYPEC